jgi:hypothetical protein
MEDNSTSTSTTSAEVKTKTDNATPNDYGGGVPSTFTDGHNKLGWVGIFLLGLTASSLIYSIYYYRKSLELQEKGQDTNIQKLKADIDLIKTKLEKLVGKKI